MSIVATSNSVSPFQEYEFSAKAPAKQSTWSTVKNFLYGRVCGNFSEILMVGFVVTKVILAVFFFFEGKLLIGVFLLVSGAHQWSLIKDLRESMKMSKAIVRVHEQADIHLLNNHQQKHQIVQQQAIISELQSITNEQKENNEKHQINNQQQEEILKSFAQTSGETVEKMKLAEESLSQLPRQVRNKIKKSIKELSQLAEQGKLQSSQFSELHAAVNSDQEKQLKRIRGVLKQVEAVEADRAAEMNRHRDEMEKQKAELERQTNEQLAKIQELQNAAATETGRLEELRKNFKRDSGRLTTVRKELERVQGELSQASSLNLNSALALNGRARNISTSSSSFPRKGMEIPIVLDSASSAA